LINLLERITFLTTLYDLTDVVNCMFHMLTTAPPEAVLFIRPPSVLISLSDDLRDPAVDFVHFLRVLKKHLLTGHGAHESCFA